MKEKINVDFSTQKLPHQVWNVSRNMGGNSTCIDGVITGVMAPPLLEHQVLVAKASICLIYVLEYQ